nr:LamG domain-containing protein [Lachnospiraceae bacterium]
RDASEWIDTKGPIFEPGVWRHVAMSYNTETEEAILYLDGKAVAYTNQVPTQRYVYNFWLGGDPYKPSFIGDLSELVIYPEVKSAEEIKKIYEAY